MSDDFAGLDATAQAELVRSGDSSPAELVEAAIGRIEALNGELNAVIHPLFEQARDLRKKCLGEGHPHYIRTLNDLAGLYWIADQPARAAQRLGLRALDLLACRFGESREALVLRLGDRVLAAVRVVERLLP